MNKSMFLAGVLSIASLAFAAGKSYVVAFAGPTKAGTVQISQGEYTVKVDGDKAVFTDEHFKKISVPVKVETVTGAKYTVTAVEGTHKDGSTILVSIQLKGSNTKLNFTN